jgi:hypothetical protein
MELRSAKTTNRRTYIRAAVQLAFNTCFWTFHVALTFRILQSFLYITAVVV